MLGHSTDKYVTGTMSQTSIAHRWSKLHAERWSHAPGELPPLVPRDTEIAMLLRGHTAVDRRGGGMRQYTEGGRGTIWLCPAGVEEEFISVDKPMDDCLHVFLPGQPFADTMLQEFDLDPTRVELRYESVERDPFIEYVAGEILRELSMETAAGRLLCESLGVALAAHLVRHYAGTPVRLPSPPRAEKPLDHRRLQRVREYVMSNLDQEDITVQSLAAVACMSVAHFARSFRAATGMTPHGYVSDERMALAKVRLRDETQSITEIALAAGFSSHSNFTRAFRNATGMTPAMFRARLLER
ncbi:helix-turn-helix domain-containing protein [Azospirillum endophyticum]